MTLYVKRDGQNVMIGGNIGLSVQVVNGQVGNYSISEHASHLRWFWGELGRQLDAAEAEVNVDA